MNGSCPVRASFSYFHIFILLLIASLLFSACNTPTPATQVSNNTAAPAQVEVAPTLSPASVEPTKATATEVAEPTPVALEEVGPSGWVLVESKYYQSKSDIDILGGPVRSAMTGSADVLLDTYRDEGVQGNMLFSVTRTDGAGKFLVNSIWRVKWTDPAAFLPAGQPASLTIEHELIADWGTPRVTANFDMPDMEPGFASSSPIRFVHEHGGNNPYRDLRAEVSGAKETMYTEKPLPEGKAGDRRAIYINFGQGYGMRYTYEWQTNVKINASEPTLTAAGQTGWVLVETKYFQSKNDIDILGGPVRSAMTGSADVLLDTYRDEGVQGNMLFSVTRTDGAGKFLVNSVWRVKWTDPATFLLAGESASLTIEHELIADWGTPRVTANFDMPDMEPGYSSSSPIRFLHEHGGNNPYRDLRAEVSGAKETMYTEKPLPEGKAGDRRAIYINFGQGYGMRYTYEWRP